jgi:hypothetical protein
MYIVRENINVLYRGMTIPEGCPSLKWKSWVSKDRKHNKKQNVLHLV